jgi:hypothetical protein
MSRVDELRLTQPPPELEPLIARDPLVRACWEYFRRGDVSYEKCLLMMATELARQRWAMTDEVVRLSQHAPPMVVVTTC